jgi:hypothetical protein
MQVYYSVKCESLYKKKRKKNKKLDLIGDKHKLLMSNQPSDSAYYDTITPSGVEFHYIMSCIYLKQERGNINI